MKNVVKLANYDLSRELEAAMRDFVSHDHNGRHHESLDHVTPPDVYSGRQYEVLSGRANIKRLTMQKRKQKYLADQAA